MEPQARSARRAAEIAKYDAAYAVPHYKMGETRKRQSMEALKALSHRGSYLDVGCGRGEMVDYAIGIGFDRAIGVDPCKRLGAISAYAWDLPFPDKEFDVVTMFDVIEHLLPEDEPRVLQELKRVASKAILITANNKPSYHREEGKEPVNLHINKKPYPVWDAIFKKVFTQATWLKRRKDCVSEIWSIVP